MGTWRRFGLVGMTLIELLVVLVIVSALATLGAPALSGMVEGVRLTAGSNTLFASVLLARSEAVKRKGRVVLCKSATGDACSSLGGWEQGWIVFHDANNNAAFDAGEALLSREPPLHASLRLAGNAQVAQYVSYGPDGATRLVSGAFQAGTLTACVQSASPSQARQIVLYKSGRPRISKTTVNACS